MVQRKAIQSNQNNNQLFTVYIPAKGGGYKGQRAWKKNISINSFHKLTGFLQYWFSFT